MTLKTLDEQTQSLASYLPTGRAFGAKNIQDTVTRGLLVGLSGELIRNEALIEEFKQEIIPDETVEFLSEWESALAIPDGCFTGNGTDDERRQDILAKLASLGVQTAEDFRLLALQIYDLNITITTPEETGVFPWTFPHTFGIDARTARFTIQINLEDVGALARFPYTFPIQFGGREIAILDCLFQQLKPANVDLFITSEIPPSFDGGANSLDFSGDVTNELRFGGGVATGFGGGNSAYTFMAWVKHDGGPNSVIIHADGTTGSDNHILAHITSGTVFDMQTTDFSGNLKHYQWPSGAINAWHQAVAVYDPIVDELKVYVDGVEDTSPTVVSNVAQTMTDGPLRSLHLGNENGVANDAYDGLIYAAGIWNVGLTALEVAASFNSGDGRHFDLTTNQGDYQSASLLPHWWRPGNEPSPNFGRDSGTLPVDLTSIVALTDSDRTADAPQ